MGCWRNARRPGRLDYTEPERQVEAVNVAMHRLQVLVKPVNLISSMMGQCWRLCRRQSVLCSDVFLKGSFRLCLLCQEWSLKNEQSDSGKSDRRQNVLLRDDSLGQTSNDGDIEK